MDFGKEGGGGGQLNFVLKCGAFARTHATFFSLFMKFGGAPKGGWVLTPKPAALSAGNITARWEIQLRPVSHH